MGDKRKNMPKSKRMTLAGRVSVGKPATAGAKDRETDTVKAVAVMRVDASSLQSFVRESSTPGAAVYTDDASLYIGLEDFEHATTNHSVGEHVRGRARTNGIEEFRAMLKRGYVGTIHWFSAKFLQRYLNEFALRHELRDRDTIQMMDTLVSRMIGRHQTFAQLADEEAT